MIRTSAAVALSMVSVAAFAGWTLDPDTNILTYDVATGVTETNTTTLTSTLAGVVKTGGGTIVFTTASTAFTGKPVTVSGGTLEMRHTDALGSGNTVTVAGDATLSMIIAAADNKGGEKNDVVLQQDATLIVGGDGGADYFIGNVTLEGDATIDVQSRRGLGKTLDLAGHTLTRVGKSVEFMFAGNGTAGTTAVVKGPGTILNSVAATITLMGAPSFQGEGTIESAHGSTTINMWNLAVPMPWKFKATESANFRLGRGYVGGQSANPAANIWAGDVEIAAGKTISLTISSNSYSNDYLTIAGDISGEGGIDVSTKAEFRLSSTNNTYSGGTKISSNFLRVYADGNVSTNGPIKLYDGFLELHLDGGKITSAYVEGMANQMATSLYDGRGTLRFVTSSGTTATLTSDMSEMHPSIAIHHEGDGSLTLGGKVPSGAMVVNQAGSFDFDGDWSRTVWSFQCLSGMMDVKGGSLCHGYQDGKRTYRIGSSNNVASARMRVQSGGMLNFPCGSGGASEPVHVMDAGTKPAILEIYEGAAVTAKVQVAANEGTKGAVYQYGGDVYHTSRPGNDGSIGYQGKAYWWMNGGTFASDHANPYVALGTRTGGEALFEVHGGKVTLPNSNSFLLCRGGASLAELYMGGGTADINTLRLGGELQWGTDHGADPGGMAVVTLTGTNNPTLTSNAVRLNERTNEFTSVVNLNAGLLTASTLSDVTASSATRKDCKSFVNFNGGALKTANTTFLDGARATRVTVYGKGGSVEFTGTGQLNWYVPFQCPEGRGVKSITVPSDVALDGYAMPPVVKISGGGGEGATAHVRFDPRTGMIEREIEVTCPGWGFITAPTVTITEADMTTPVTCEVVLTEGDQESGGLTVKKGGSGTSAYLMVYAANTYTGDTVIAGGTFYMQHAEAVPLQSNIRLAGGHLATRGFNPSRARLGGHGSFASWDSNRLTITGEIYYDAADLAQERKIRCSGGHFYIGSNCALTIDGLDALLGGTYLLMDTSGTGKIHGTARFANDNPRWKLAFSESKITLKYVRGTTFTLR